MTQPKHFFYNDPNSQAESLAKIISSALSKDIKEKGQALLILPGGSSPRILIQELAQENLPWQKIEITVTDERCVPLKSEHSNIGQIKRLCSEQGLSISPLPLWDEKINDKADIRSLSWPATVTVLGMGLDGHIASLFPKQTWSAKSAQIIDASAPSEPRKRVSLTLETLASSQHIILLVNGDEKWNLYQRIKNSEYKETPLEKLINIAGNKLHVHVYTTSGL